jgi:hypothetical protein
LTRGPQHAIISGSFGRFINSLLFAAVKLKREHFNALRCQWWLSPQLYVSIFDMSQETYLKLTTGCRVSIRRGLVYLFPLPE